MILARKGDALAVACPAKINLFLETRGLRPDGYHEIETVMQAVTLCDGLILRPRSVRGVVLRCSAPDIPAGPDNLAFRAAELLDREIGLPCGVEIGLKKRIPAGAGLGGGSSDAAGVLAGLDELFGLGAGLEHLSALGAALGSDVPFFLCGGTALCTGRGERVRRIPAPLTLHYVICWPGRPLPTPLVYKNLATMNLTRGDRSASFTIDSLAEGDFASTCKSIFNRLEESALALAPEVREAKGLLERVASRPAFVSGSGSAVYAVFRSARQAADAAAAARARRLGAVFVARTETSGIERCE